MKFTAILLSFLLFQYASARWASKAVIGRSAPLLSTATRTSSSSRTNHVFLVPRGGQQDTVPKDTDPSSSADDSPTEVLHQDRVFFYLLSKTDWKLASDLFLKLFAGVNAFHGLILAVLPNLGAQLLYSTSDDDTDTLYAQEAIGAFSLEYGLTGYLAASGLVAPDKAIGYGTLPDLLFLIKNLVNGRFVQFHVQSLMLIMTLIAVACTTAILTDKLHVGPILEILTIIPAIQGSFKYLDPVGGAKRMMGADLSEKPIAKAFYQHSGQMKLVSAVLRGGLAFGVDPLKALGYANLANAALILDSLVRSHTEKDIEGHTGAAMYHQVGSLLLAAVMGVVFVLQKK